jgi:hypothetical protein
VHRNAYYRARGWRGDLAPYDPVRLNLDPNLPLLYGFPSAGLYTPLPIRWVFDAGAFLMRPPDPRTGGLRGIEPRTAAILNVRYVIDPFRTAGPEMPLLAEFPGDVLLRRNLVLPAGPPYTVRVLENPAALPRAWLVPRARYVEDGPHPPLRMSRAQREFLAPRFDPRREVLITEEAPPEIPPPSGPETPIPGGVTFLEYAPSQIRLETNVAADAWLCLSDTWYPGWIAEVDGEPVRIRRANLSGRAIPVPAGRHRVEFRFVPGAYRRGLLLSAAGFLLLLLAGAGGILLRRRRTGS